VSATTPPSVGDTAGLLTLAETVLAQTLPGEHLEVFVGRGRSTSVRVYGGEVESLTSSSASGVGIRVVTDRRQGFAWAGTLEPDIVRDVLDDARDNARFGEPDEFQGLAEPDGVEAVDQDLWHDAVLSLPVADKIDLALRLEQATLSRDPRIRRVRNAVYGDGSGEAAIASTTGIRASWRSTSSRLAVSAIAEDGDETYVGAFGDAGRDHLELDLEDVADQASARAVRLFGARAVPSQRLSVVLEPRMAATVLGIAAGMLSGERVLKGRSPFADRRGEQIAAPAVTLVDDPTDSRSYGADTFDGEGLACRRNELIVDGVLRGFLHNSYTGRRSGAGSTGSAVRGFRSTPGVGHLALALTPGDRAVDELVAGVDRGVLVQSMTGLHSGVNAVSGDFSVGIEGVMIRDGVLGEPVREVTIGSTLQRLLLDVVAVGADLEWLPGGSASSTLVIGDVSLGGT
jgi:PmbA protein